MTHHQRTILLALNTGKPVAEICKDLGISRQNLYTSTYRMRKNGIEIPKQTRTASRLTSKQRIVLHYYMLKTPVHQIAKAMQIDSQTVMNHAAQGFARLGLTTAGVDRVEALRAILEPPNGVPPVAVPITMGNPPSGGITMEDPFFN